MGELAQAQNHHELDWRSLLSSQRQVAELTAVGTEPDIDTFWSKQAQPRSEELTASWLQIIDAHLLLLWDAVSVFADGVVPALALNGRPPSDEAMQSLRADVVRLIEPVASAAPDRRMLDGLGERWQERLRRQAIRRYVRIGGTATDSFAGAIDALELKMIGQAPWAHADHLLSAFELAHAEVRRELADRIERMLDDLLSA